VPHRTRPDQPRGLGSSISRTPFGDLGIEQKFPGGLRPRAPARYRARIAVISRRRLRRVATHLFAQACRPRCRRLRVTDRSGCWTDGDISPAMRQRHSARFGGTKRTGSGERLEVSRHADAIHANRECIRVAEGLRDFASTGVNAPATIFRTYWTNGLVDRNRR
jgi:hypothetical protein